MATAELMWTTAQIPKRDKCRLIETIKDKQIADQPSIGINTQVIDHLTDQTKI